VLPAPPLLTIRFKSVQVRAIIGASLSIMDMVSDSVVIVDYYATDRSGYAMMLVGMVLSNIALQIVIVYIQTRGIGSARWRTFFFDSLAVLTFWKPGLDAWRVASGYDQQSGAVFGEQESMRDDAPPLAAY
jgi:hypothetical protein